MEDRWIDGEKWLPLDEFPDYAVSSEGRIINTRNDVFKKPSSNQQGIAIVNLYKEQRQNVRSVAVLVSDAFLDHSAVPPHFDTPIHLNGDKMDCRADNLHLRPRWFAVQYHQQFKPEARASRFGFRGPVEIIETGEVFDSSFDAAVKYGLLDREIFIATVNRTFVFPHRFTFRPLEE